MNWAEILANVWQALTVPHRIYHQVWTNPLVDIPLWRVGNWTGWEAERLLAYFGVRIYSRGFDPMLGEAKPDSTACLHLYVSIQQAIWAEYLLLAARAPVALIRWHSSYPPFMPAPWHAPLKPAGISGRLLTALDALTGNTISRHLEQLLQAGTRRVKCSYRRLRPNRRRRSARRPGY